MPDLYWRPLARTGAPRPLGALPLAGGLLWFDSLVSRGRGAPARILPLEAAPPEVLARLTAPRAPVAGVPMDAPRVMAILNATPDSFSDGGRHIEPRAARASATAMRADILDVGGESTRPGASAVPEAEELARVLPVLEAVAGLAPVSIDTRKAAVARAALEAGAAIVNDVSAMTHDPAMAAVVAASGAAVVLMHAAGDPETMQNDPRYEDAPLDVYDALAARLAAAEAAGIPRARIILDPGIGFGKREAHNLQILREIALYHSLGCALMLGASRKAFVGRIGGAEAPAARMPGSLAVALHGASQGVQILRVHDSAETAQALALWRAVTEEPAP